MEVVFQKIGRKIQKKKMEEWWNNKSLIGLFGARKKTTQLVKYPMAYGRNADMCCDVGRRVAARGICLCFQIGQILRTFIISTWSPSWI